MLYDKRSPSLKDKLMGQERDRVALEEKAKRTVKTKVEVTSRKRKK